MASAGKPSQDTTKTKVPLTPEQRKLYTGLGVAGLLTLVAGGIFLPGMLGRKTEPALPTSPPNAVSVPAADGAAPAGTNAAGVSGAPGEVTPGAGAAGAVTPVVTPGSQQLARFRPDPFQQLYFFPTPTPVPPPIPPPVPVPLPGEVTPVMLPGASATRLQAQQPLNLPPVSINRLDEATRRPVDAFPPRRSEGGSGGGGSVTPSSDKRLSGVVIGEGVRALLEIQGPDGPKTTVVQPGDEVNGITVLSIQRFNDGTRTVTRMIIRENGEERSVDLRAGAQLSPAGGGLGQPGA